MHEAETSNAQGLAVVVSGRRVCRPGRYFRHAGADENTGGARGKADGAVRKSPRFPLSLFTQATKDDYVDEAACKECHAGPHASFDRSPHKPFVMGPKDVLDKHGCQSCHGPGGPHMAHLENPDEIYKYIVSYTHLKPMEGSTVCMRCHNDTMTMAHWRRTGHAQANVGCTDCHEIHKDAERQAAASRASNAAKALKVPFYITQRESNRLLKGDEVTLCASCHKTRRCGSSATTSITRCRKAASSAATAMRSTQSRYSAQNVGDDERQYLRPDSAGRAAGPRPACVSRAIRRPRGLSSSSTTRLRGFRGMAAPSATRRTAPTTRSS